MEATAKRSLYVDTGAFYAHFDDSASRHERATAVFDWIGTAECPYSPVYTSTYVLDELATLVLSHRDHAAAKSALDRVLDSSVVVLHPDETDFRAAYDEFCRYDDHGISFTDHVSGVLAADRGIECVFTFDADHFRTLGFTVVPEDTGEP